MALLRFFIFLISYGLLISSLTQMILYLNYRSLGYDWSAVFSYIVQTPDFYLLIFALVLLILSVYVRGPLRFPFVLK